MRKRAFSAFLFQVIGNKHVLLAAIEHPIFSAAQPDAISAARPDADRFVGSAEQPAAMLQFAGTMRSRTRERALVAYTPAYGKTLKETLVGQSSRVWPLAKRLANKSQGHAVLEHSTVLETCSYHRKRW